MGKPSLGRIWRAYLLQAELVFSPLENPIAVILRVKSMVMSFPLYLVFCLFWTHDSQKCLARKSSICLPLGKVSLEMFI